MDKSDVTEHIYDQVPEMPGRRGPGLAPASRASIRESRREILIQPGVVAVTGTNVGELIERARRAAGLSQRALADVTGISQSTLSRIISGDRAAKMPEIVLIAQGTGHAVAQLTGTATVADRMQCAARATNGSGMEGMREALLRFLELNDYLDDQAIPATV
jgi:transcriptional regulator with XRE-family HTH domain